MKRFSLLLLTGICLLLSGCQQVYDIYIRNTTTQPALMHLYLTNTAGSITLPDRVPVANRAVNFKRGYKKYIDSSLTFNRVDSSHFTLALPANTTVDVKALEIQLRRYNNQQPVRATVIIATQGGTDTLMNQESELPRFEKFSYVFMGPFTTHTYYYDVVPGSGQSKVISE